MNIKFNKRMFYLVIVLLMALPVLKHLELFLYGETTEATADHIGKQYVEYGNLTFMVYRFTVNDKNYFIEDAPDIRCDFNTKRRIIYTPRNPAKCIIPTFSYLYLSYNALLPLFILMLWVAFYTSFFTDSKEDEIITQPRLE